MWSDWNGWFENKVVGIQRNSSCSRSLLVCFMHLSKQQHAKARKRKKQTNRPRAQVQFLWRVAHQWPLQLACTCIMQRSGWGQVGTAKEHVQTKKKCVCVCVCVVRKERVCGVFPRPSSLPLAFVVGHTCGPVERQCGQRHTARWWLGSNQASPQTA